MFNKVLVLSASAGAGHLRAAQAVEKALLEANAAREVRNIDTLEYTSKIFQHLYSKAYIDVVNKMPELPGFFYDRLDKPWKNERRRLALDKLNTRPFVKMLKRISAGYDCLYAFPSSGNCVVAEGERTSCQPSGNCRDGF